MQILLDFAKMLVDFLWILYQKFLRQKNIAQNLKNQAIIKNKLNYSTINNYKIYYFSDKGRLSFFRFLGLGFFRLYA